MYFYQYLPKICLNSLKKGQIERLPLSWSQRIQCCYTWQLGANILFLSRFFVAADRCGDPSIAGRWRFENSKIIMHSHSMTAFQHHKSEWSPFVSVFGWYKLVVFSIHTAYSVYLVYSIYIYGWPLHQTRGENLFNLIFDRIHLFLINFPIRCSVLVHSIIKTFESIYAMEKNMKIIDFFFFWSDF